MITTYYGSGQWFEDVRAALDNWKLTGDEKSPYSEIRWVEAEAGTGSRYAVIITPLGPYARSTEGGPFLVSVTSPWQAAYAMADVSVVEASYIAEKFCGDRARLDHLHGGDLAALTKTIAYALGCEAQIRTEH